MLLPESDTIAAEHPELADEIRRIDRYLCDVGQQPLRLGPTVDLLHIEPGPLMRLLRLYEASEAIEQVEVYICPIDDTVIEANEEGVLWCDLCEGEYREDECEREQVYRVQPGLTPTPPSTAPREHAAAQIFLSYAREDKVEVESLYHRLSDAGLRPWMDAKDILPGEQWQSSIKGAIRGSDFFLACLSRSSVTKRGWIQREIKGALDIWQEMLDSDIYLIPVRLEDCEVPDRLRDFQWVDLFAEDGWMRLLEAIRTGIRRREVLSPHESASEDLTSTRSPSPRASTELVSRGRIDEDPPLAAIRDLLLDAFTAEDFRRLLLYTSQSALRQILDQFSPSDGLDAMVERVIVHCQKHDLLRVLLQEVKKANPRQYDKHRDRLHGFE